MKIKYPFIKYINFAKELFYNKCEIDFSNLKQNIESEEYGSFTFELNGKKVQHRFSKITPTKIGQFVTIWKRNIEGITQPYDILDDLDFIIISSINDEKFGQFIFPKKILADKGIISHNGKNGKRGIRVYPPWDRPINKQGIQTQSWQLNYFFTIKSDLEINFDLLNILIA